MKNVPLTLRTENAITFRPDPRSVPPKPTRRTTPASALLSCVSYDPLPPAVFRRLRTDIPWKESRSRRRFPLFRARTKPCRKRHGQAYGASAVSRPMPYPEPTASRIFRQTRPDSIFRPHALLDPDNGSGYPLPHERKEPDSDQGRPGQKNVRTSRLCASVRRRKTQTVPRKKCFATGSRPKK